MRCSGKLATGARCARPAMSGSRVCFGHDPKQTAFRRANGKKAGRRSALSRQGAEPAVDVAVAARKAPLRRPTETFSSHVEPMADLAMAIRKLVRAELRAMFGDG